MKWGITNAERRRRQNERDDNWLAWHPVRLADTGQWVWLERLQRIFWPSYDGGWYEYHPRGTFIRVVPYPPAKE
jgi:hypothetical protein